VEGYRHSRTKMRLAHPRYGITSDSIDNHLFKKGFNFFNRI
jgi:hypothetical protein